MNISEINDNEEDIINDLAILRSFHNPYPIPYLKPNKTPLEASEKF